MPARKKNYITIKIKIPRRNLCQEQDSRSPPKIKSKSLRVKKVKMHRSYMLLTLSEYFGPPSARCSTTLHQKPIMGLAIHLHKCLISLYSLSALIKTPGKTAAEQVV